MGKKHRRTLQAIFAHPVSGTIPWRSVEALLQALGATIEEGEGSAIRVTLHEVKEVFHRPHPRKETDKGAIRSVRAFLQRAGESP